MFFKQVKFPVIQGLTLRLGVVLLMMTITKLLFLAFNYNRFENISLSTFLYAAWFDCITIALYFSPFIFLYLLPLQNSFKNIQTIVLKTYFLSVITLMLALNLMDIEYFQFTKKRSTFDLFTMLTTGSDFSQLATTFLKDFWLLIVFLIFLVIVSNWLYNKVSRKSQVISYRIKNFSWNFMLFIPLVIIIARGGFGLKPIGIIEASNYSNPENTALVLNTPFTMLKSFGKEHLEQKNFFSDKEALHFFNPIQISKPQHILPDGTNVMIIILESFGNEFVGAFNHSKSYTPFFDSLIAQSLTFEYGIANGKKSIEAVPAIVASIPTLMDNPYISSPYGNNRINSLATILRKNGYETAFYHGSTNGSMRFDGFAAQVGFQHYFGRYEYNNDAHFDKTWGILDEYFNPWTAQQMTKLKEPFFSTLFTLSSHHPYYIPPHMRKQVIRGPQPICASINYGDYSLRKFFEAAKKQPWYQNTLFILLADHTPATDDKTYSERRMMYQIPIVFYHPRKLLPVKKEKKIFQQLDILPTVLDLLNIQTKFYAFGQSLYKKSEREAITYIEGTYYYFINRHMFSFSDGKARNLYDIAVGNKFTTDSLSFYKAKSVQVENRIKAIIQRYNRDLVHNQTVIE